MEIKAFRPIIFTKDASGLIKQFEALGFESRHVKENIDNAEITSTVMKDTKDNTVVFTAGPKFEQTFAGLSVMVDNFDEALKEFEALGYVNIQAKTSSDTGTSVATLLRSPEGLFISVAEHTK